MSDPYTTRDDAKQPPPVSWAARCRQLGPSIVISGSIVGSGELILTSSLGAGVLHASGQQPQGLETVEVLSAMFTNTFGGWPLWLFGGAAFCILASSVVAGFGGISRFLPDYLIEFGYLDRANLGQRMRWIRGRGGLLPIASMIAYLVIPSPVALLTIGALMGAALLPVQSGATIWLQRRRMDARVRPSAAAHVLLWLTFLFQLSMAALVAWFIVR